MELIEIHNLEAPTGIEVIKRLLNKDLIEEFEDAEDKRAKRVKITLKGKKELERMRPKIDRKFKDFAKTLQLNDKLLLVSNMSKLIQT